MECLYFIGEEIEIQNGFSNLPPNSQLVSGGVKI